MEEDAEVSHKGGAADNEFAVRGVSQADMGREVAFEAGGPPGVVKDDDLAFVGVGAQATSTQPVRDLLIAHGSFLDRRAVGCACRDDAPIIDVQFCRPRARFPVFCFA